VGITNSTSLILLAILLHQSNGFVILQQIPPRISGGCCLLIMELMNYSHHSLSSHTDRSRGFSNPLYQFVAAHFMTPLALARNRTEPFPDLPAETFELISGRRATKPGTPSLGR
jgi:hypothetical protein